VVQAIATRRRENLPVRFRLASVASGWGGTLADMRTLLPDPAPDEFEQLLERRRQWGADTRDEAWEGVLHMNPAPHRRHARLQAQPIELLGRPARARGLTPLGEFNLGEPENYRVPDAALHRPGPDELYNPTAALVIEIVSPGDDTWSKLPFYAAHDVDELLIVDPQSRTVKWLALEQGEYRPTEQSQLIPLGPTELAERIDWPTVESEDR
jgi:Uma2 family endonuclease